jgi:hypothetical protein
MKTIIFISSFIFVGVAYNQKIVINLTKIKSYSTHGNLDPNFVINNPEWSSPLESVDSKFIVDLKTNNVKSYDSGILVTNLKPISIVNKNEIYYLSFVERDVNHPGTTVNTTMIVDMKNNTYVFYFYDHIYNFTRVETGTNLTMSLIN